MRPRIAELHHHEKLTKAGRSMYKFLLSDPKRKESTGTLEHKFYLEYERSNQG